MWLLGCKLDYIFSGMLINVDSSKVVIVSLKVVGMCLKIRLMVGWLKMKELFRFLCKVLVMKCRYCWYIGRFSFSVCEVCCIFFSGVFGVISRWMGLFIRLILMKVRIDIIKIISMFCSVCFNNILNIVLFLCWIYVGFLFVIRRLFW